jgi:hypothetical protein
LETIKLLAEEAHLDWNAKTKNNKNFLDLARHANEQPNPEVFPDVEAFIMARVACS